MRIAAARVSLGLFVLLSVCGAAWGQATARLAGIVKDPSGGSVAGAAITLTNEGTNVSRKTTTDADGNFLFPQVEPGVYRATIVLQSQTAVPQYVNVPVMFVDVKRLN